MQLTFDEWFEKELPGAKVDSEIYEIAKAAWEASRINMRSWDC